MANVEKRISKSGKITYRVKIRLKGHPVQSATFDRLTDARKWAQQTEAAIREGRYFKTTEAKRHTFAEAIDRYIKYILPTKPKSQRDQTIQLNWWKDEIGSHILADVTPALIAENRDKLARGDTARGKKRTAATVNRYLSVISHLFTIAVREWGWLAENPLSKVTKLKEPRGRVRYLSDDERDALLSACKESKNPYLYLVVVLALSTGARRMELLGLRWEDVDLNRKVIILHQTKNNERRILPITGFALELMQKHFAMRSYDTDLGDMSTKLCLCSKKIA